MLQALEPRKAQVDPEVAVGEEALGLGEDLLRLDPPELVPGPLGQDLHHLRLAGDPGPHGAASGEGEAPLPRRTRTSRGELHRRGQGGMRL